MQFEGPCLAQEEGDICIGGFVFDEFAGDNNQAAQVGCPDNCLVEIRCKADGI